MAVTIQQIAEKAGVSRGTVDRALNKRGRISPEVEAKVLRVAGELGYVPKERKKRENRQQKRKIGIVTQLAKSAFTQEIHRGIEKARKELSRRGVELLVRKVFSVDVEKQLEAIDELAGEGISGLAIMPADNEKIREKLNLLTSERGIPVVTFNSDIVGTGRSCFVGMDNRQSGRAAAGLMGMMTGGAGKVLVITGFFSNNVSNRRVDGFVEEIKNSYPDMELVGVQGSFDDADEVENIIVSTMLNVTELNGIFVISGGQEGIQRAFDKLQLERRPHTIIYDLTPENIEALRAGTVDFLIDQNGFVQGYEPPFILNDILSGNQPEREYRYTDISIKTKYNI